MVDAVLDGVFEARRFHWAVSAEFPGDLDPDTVARKKHGRMDLSALPDAHPLCVHLATSLSTDGLDAAGCTSVPG
jgi:hypothetical protein